MNGQTAGRGREYVAFDGFFFPVFSTMEYRLDGPDKERPDRLFIRDEKGRFMFSFEQNFSVGPAFSPGREHEFVEILHKGRKLLLWYPKQEENLHKQMGYFRLGCPEGVGLRPCCGQLMISRPADYLQGLREIPEIFEVLSSIIRCGSDGNAPTRAQRRELL